ncbi:MAG: hypothetical protein DPW16_10825 [Chloroflexi bacterium]|nr:hypothetical protein [Chloroflexota bacterium]
MPRPPRKFGYLLETWEKIKQEAFEILVDHARQRKTITYGELAGLIQTAEINPYSYAMSGLLRDISLDDEKAGRGYLATLVVRKSDGRPGPGYFKGVVSIAEEDYESYWQAEFERTCASWAEKK